MTQTKKSEDKNWIAKLSDNAIRQYVVAFVVISGFWLITPFLMEIYLEQQGAGAEAIAKAKEGAKENSLHFTRGLFEYIEADSKKADIYSSFNALNTLFAGLAFAGVFISLRMQGKTNKRHEKEIKRQHAASLKQSFEHNFFQMLATLNDSINLISAYDKRGRAAIHLLCKDQLIDEGLISWYENTGDQIINTYQIFYNKHNYHLEVYFRLVAQILKYIDQTDVKDKQMYSNFLRAQFTSSELSLLFIHCLAFPGNGNHKKRLEKFSFFKHLRIGNEIHDDHVAEFNNKAFKSNNELMESHRKGVKAMAGK